MNYKDMSVSKKMLVSVILLLVVFTVVIVSYALISFNDLTNEMSTKDANISLELLEGEVNSLKEQSKNITVLLAKNPELTKAVANRSKEEIISSVNKITAGLSIEFITLMDTEGNVLARIHQPEKSGDNLAYQDNIKGAIQGKTLSLIEEGTAIKLSARTGAPLYDETGTFVGVVSTGYRFDKEQTVDNLKSITGNEFTIFLGDERVSSTIMVDGKRAIGTKLDPVIANIILKEGKEYNGEADILGVPYITSYKPLRGGEKNDIIGVLFSGVPLSQVKAANKSMITMIVVLTAAFLLVLIWILSVIIKKIIGIPVNTLTGMAKEVALGNVDLKIDYESKDEIGELAASFRDLLATQKEKAIAAESISRGDTDVIISLRSDRDILSHSILKVAETNKELVKEFEYLIKAALDGKLKTRGNSDRFSGGYKELITGVNSLLEAVVAPVQEGSKVLERMAQGDFTARVTGEFKGDHQIITNSINTVAESLNSALSQVSEAVQATASAASQISSSSEEMAAGSQEQSAQTTEVASAVEEMTSTIMENTKNASYAAEATKESAVKAKEGGKVVSETVDGMNRISEVVSQSAEAIYTLGQNSDKIGEIIQVIDDIADQTNLLALNAAIEAARAGEQGRGFAVVADEVRKLAERTTKATKEIAMMIKQIQKDTGSAVESMQKGTEEVEKGKALVNKAGSMLGEIISSSEKATDSVIQVAAASEEQSAASEEISKNVEAIRSVTQESTVGIQQIARAAEDLNRLTETLQNLVSKFNIDNGRGSHYSVRGAGKLIKQ
jgi:methyl-accepting chemotaxis protein